MKIYLDDVRTPVDKTWTVVRSYEEFVSLIESIPSHEQSKIEISFDHDLGVEYFYENTGDGPSDYNILYEKYTEKTGYDCAKWLVDNDIVPAMVWVHSSNPVGAENILGLLNNWYKFHDLTTRGYKTAWEFTA